MQPAIISVSLTPVLLKTRWRSVIICLKHSRTVFRGHPRFVVGIVEKSELVARLEVTRQNEPDPVFDFPSPVTRFIKGGAKVSQTLFLVQKVSDTVSERLS